MIKKILKIVGIVIVSIGVVVLLFIKFWPSLGGRVTEDIKQEILYIKKESFMEILKLS